MCILYSSTLPPVSFLYRATKLSSFSPNNPSSTSSSSKLCISEFFTKISVPSYPEVIQCLSSSSNFFFLFSTTLDLYLGVLNSFAIGFFSFIFPSLLYVYNQDNPNTTHRNHGYHHSNTQQMQGHHSSSYYILLLFLFLFSFILLST